MARKRRRRWNWCFIAVVCGIACAVVAYVVGAAALQAKLTPFRFDDLLVPRIIDCLMVGWLFWIGSAIGSFLNVVAWRMPRGKSVNGLSHCPWCGQRLDARDNWPVFGWIALRGRCRTCRLPISPRYPIVEFVVGFSLLLVGMSEVYNGLSNLPTVGPVVRRASGPMAMPMINREVLLVWVYHTAAVAGSWAFGLVRFDGQRLPRVLVAWVMGLAIVPMLVWPRLAVVGWQMVSEEQAWQVLTLGGTWNHLEAAARIITGAVAAIFIARTLVRYLCPTADPKLDPLGRGTGRLIDLTGILVLPGVLVGWQALIGVVLLATVIAATLRHWANLKPWLAQGRDGLAWFAIAIPAALTIQIVIWRLIEEVLPLPSTRLSPGGILLFGLAILIVPVLLREPRYLMPSDYGDTAPPTTPSSAEQD